MNENNSWISPDGRSPNQQSQTEDLSKSPATQDNLHLPANQGEPGNPLAPAAAPAPNLDAPSSEGASDSSQPHGSANSPLEVKAPSATPANGQINQVAPMRPNPSAQYGANQFWGQPGFSDPYAAKPLQTSATWGGKDDAKKLKRGPGWLGAIGIAVAASLITTGGFYFVSDHLPGRAEASESTLFNPEDKGVTTPAPVANSNSQNPDWEAVAEAVRPAVVAIIVEAGNTGDEGSGSIIDSKGHILTNNHVVADADGGNGLITVELYDGRLYEAEIVGRDVLTDLAVIKIKNPPQDLTVVALGDSSELQVGESVAAIGNPLGLSSTVTTGIVSALDRPVRVDAVPGGNQNQGGNGNELPFNLRDLFGEGYGQGQGFGLGGENGQGMPGGSAGQANSDTVTTNAIQVDAAVNPGNSGGPLFDAKGRVIGVTSSIATLSGASGFGQSQSGGSIGLGFAIPINQAQMIATQLIEHGEAVHAALGITVTEDIATVGEVSRLGALVQDISSGSAAKKAGLENGDIIVGIDGKQVKGSESLVGWVRQYAVGDTVELEIVRDGKEMKVSVTLQAQ